MASGERTIRIKFDGITAGLARAGKRAERIVKDVRDKVGKSGGVIGKLFSDGFLAAFDALPAKAKAVAIAAAATIATYMSAAVGAAMTAGILLALSGGVLAAGIKAAAASPQVQKAWKHFTDRAKKAVKPFGDAFIGPVTRALDTFGDTLEKLKPDFEQIGESMAPIIDKLAPALGKMAENAMPGIQNALEASKPLWDTLSEHMPHIGKAIKYFFDQIAKGGPGANKFLDDMLTWAQGFLALLGWIIGHLASLYGWLRDIPNKATRLFIDFGRFFLALMGRLIQAAASAFGWIPGLGPKLKSAAAKFEEFRKKANRELDKIKSRTIRVDIVTRHLDDGTVHSHNSNSGGGRAGTGIAGRRAGGGPVSAGRTYLVGELGAELFTPAVNGRITPNDEFGGDTHVTVIIDGEALDSSVVRVMSRRDRQLRRTVGAGVRA